jgi:acyl carrier protein
MRLRQEEELLDQVRALLEERFGLPPGTVTPDLAFGDVPQWDSLGHIELLIGLEEKFGVDVDIVLISELTSVPAICGFLKERRHV